LIERRRRKVVIIEFRGRSGKRKPLP